MDEIATILGMLSGLRFVAPELTSPVMLVTAIGIQITHAIICRIFAAQRGRSGTGWMIAGLLAGVLAVAVLLILAERDDRSPREPAAN